MTGERSDDATGLTPTAIGTLRAALRAEHAAVYLLAVLASRAQSAALGAALTDAYGAHRAARDQLLARLDALGDSMPPGAAPAYDLPPGLGSDAGLRAAALVIEQRAAAGYADQVAATVGEDRARAIGWLDAAAVRQLRFGGAPAELPGL